MVQEQRSVSHIIPRIEKRPNCTESVPNIPEIETSNDSMLSLHLEDISDMDEVPCDVKEDASTDVPQVVNRGDANDSTHMEAETVRTSTPTDLDADNPKRRLNTWHVKSLVSSDPVLESRWKEQSKGEAVGSTTEPQACEEPRASDLI
jgi:hypothetical protein